MTLNVAILEPYYGGSHAQFVDTLTAHSRHRYVAATMPARKWKWRMRGAAIHFTRQDTTWIDEAPAGGYDVILCSDMLSVADLRALFPRTLRDVPIACYFHENQLTYPVAHQDARDFHFAVTNITSCLASDVVWFNSQYHRSAFMDATRKLLAKMPDHVPRSALDEIQKKTVVLPPPVLLDPVVRPGPADKPHGEPMTILWCHRWEYDKNPGPFLDALIKLYDENLPYRVVFLGEQFEDAPPEFAVALERLKERIHHAGWLPSRDDYLRMLSEADLVVSTAIQENFGYAVIESILSGCQPLLPNRLSYPEILGGHAPDVCLFADDVHFEQALREALNGARRLEPYGLAELQQSLIERYGPSALEAIDRAINDLVHGRCD